MKRTLVVLLAATVMAAPAYAAGPSEASATAAGSAALAISSVPLVISSGVGRAIDKSFSAVVVGVSNVASSLSEKKVEARTQQGERIELTVPAEAVKRGDIKPGSQLVGEKSAAGYVISADGKPWALATSNGQGAGLTKNKPL